MKHYALITIAVAMAAGGCASRANYSGDIKDELPAVASAGGVSGVAEAGADPAFAGLPGAADGPSGGLLDSRIIYFDYDKSAVRDDSLALIGAHSDYLNQTPGQRVILEGHADERGSNEYNLALGQRRADAVREIMLANGVQRNQIETLSFGEESPRASGQNETAWAENRRVEIRYHNE